MGPVRVPARTGSMLGAGLAFLAIASGPALAEDRSADPITVTARSQPRTAAPSVFGTVAVPFGTTPMSARWTRALSAPSGDLSLNRLTAGARTLSAYDKAAFIQSVVSRGIRNHSRPKCSDDGYWASARESLTRGVGDCVDIAIAKMEALRQLGFVPSDLYLVTGRTVGGGGLEAALMVRIQGQFYLLGTRSSQLTGAGSATSFTPVVTYGVGMTWAHGVPVDGPRMRSTRQSIARAGEPAGASLPFSGLDAHVKAK